MRKFIFLQTEVFSWSIFSYFLDFEHEKNNLMLFRFFFVFFFCMSLSLDMSLKRLLIPTEQEMNNIHVNVLYGADFKSSF